MEYIAKKKKTILRAFETTKLNNYTESADCTYVICKNSIESVILSLYMAYTQFTAVHRIIKHNGKKRNMHTVIKVRFVELLCNILRKFGKIMKILCD